MAMLDEKLAEVTQSLAQTGSELCQQVTGANRQAGQEVLERFLKEAKAFHDTMSLFQRILFEGQAKAEAQFVAARTKLLADDAVARTSWGAGLLSDMTKLLSLEADGPLGRLSREQQTFLIDNVAAPIIQAIEKSATERISKPADIGASLEEVVSTKLNELVAAYPGASHLYTGDTTGRLGVSAGDHVLRLPVPGNGTVIIAVEDKHQKAMSPKAIKDEANKVRENRGAHAVIFIAGEGVLPRALGRWGRTPEVRNGFHMVYNPADHALLACTIQMAYLLVVNEMAHGKDGVRLTRAVQQELGVMEGIITLCRSVSGQHASITKAVGEATKALADIRTVVSTSVERLRAAMLEQSAS